MQGIKIVPSTFMCYSFEIYPAAKGIPEGDDIFFAHSRYTESVTFNKGVRGGILEILRFKVSVQGFVFNANEDNSKQK